VNSNEIRRRFLEFFAARGHRVVPSASLIPGNDPTLLWTSAGMVPFKPYFTGVATPEFRRAVTCQKCLRTPDIEMVGKTARHHTFFEMLGNFSFGDYFKERAIPWAWEFVTRDLGLEPEHLWISIYLDDDEAFGHWRGLGLPAERIVRLGRDTNFWEIGVGPCGPCSEIYYDRGPAHGCENDPCGPGCDCDRWLEIWNLVFIQYFRNEADAYSPLESPGIDTGMGLERVASVLQGVDTNFDTDLFRGLIDYTAGVLGVRYGSGAAGDEALKVIGDHARAVIFAVADGVLPSNEGRGYVIRRLLRRAVRKALLLGREEPFLEGVALKVIEQMAAAYPDLAAARDSVRKVVRFEEERFRQTLTQGNEIIGRLIAEARAENRPALEGAAAFQLYDTYGFPLELTREISAEQGLAVDEAGFEAALKAQQQKARSSRKETRYVDERETFFRNLRDEIGATRFVGYEQLDADAGVTALVRDGQRVPAAGSGDQVSLVVDSTPCYAESGGQVGDHGLVEGENVRGRITDTFAPVEGLHVHEVTVEQGVLEEGARVRVLVDGTRRRKICRNHTATHLLHRALKAVLGAHVNQAGSMVAPERLRFDFTHLQPLSEAELAEVEHRINEIVLSNVKVESFQVSFDRARELGAVALFGEKYGDLVRVVEIAPDPLQAVMNLGGASPSTRSGPDLDDETAVAGRSVADERISMELCGGTHVRSTAEIGPVKITAESSVGAGLRRLEAVTGSDALAFLNSRIRQLHRIAQAVRAPVSEVVAHVERLLDEQKKLERENEQLQDRLQVYEVKEILDRASTHEGVRILTTSVRARDMAELRSMLDLLRERLGSAVIVLGSAVNGKVSLVVSVSRDLVSRGLHAGAIIKEAAVVAGGGGGGRPEMAQAGGKHPEKLAEALEKAHQMVLRRVDGGSAQVDPASLAPGRGDPG